MVDRRDYQGGWDQATGNNKGTKRVRDGWGESLWVSGAGCSLLLEMKVKSGMKEGSVGLLGQIVMDFACRVEEPEFILRKREDVTRACLFVSMEFILNLKLILVPC